VNNEPRVVIIGGGFGGLCAARGLAGAPVGIAPPAVFFVADDSKWITEETLLISRGYIRL
jgi:cation diffusion facilitator CzcD-associated flavoprotein CzcO